MTALAGAALVMAASALLVPMASIAVATPVGTITEFSAGLSPGSEQEGIVSGSDGDLWFTDVANNAIGRITPDGSITEFTEGLSSESYPTSIVVGPDGDLWFIDGGTPAAIGRITPSGTITEFTAGLTTGGRPGSLVVGPDGNLWFVDDGNNAKAIGRITTRETPEQALAPAPTPVVAPNAASVLLASTRLAAKGDRVTAIKLICTGTETCSGRLVLTTKTEARAGGSESPRQRSGRPTSRSRLARR